MMFLNIIAMIFIFIFHGTKRLLQDSYDLYIQRFFLIFVHLVSSIFLIIFYKWKELINNSNISLKYFYFIRASIAFPCFFTSIVILFPQRILINMIIILYYFIKEDFSDFMDKLDSIFHDAIRFHIL